MTSLEAELVVVDGCSVRWAAGRVVITLPTEIDLNNADLVGRHLLQVLDERPPGLVVDMTATEYCGCAGIHALARVHRQATGTTLAVAAGHNSVRRVVELTGLDKLIDLYPDVQAALAAMTPKPGRAAASPRLSGGGLALSGPGEGVEHAGSPAQP